MGIRLENTTPALSRLALLKDVYTYMLLTRLVNSYAWQASHEGKLGFVASCAGHEAAQVGSAVCIELGQDFTLPYYRDLGVVLSIGMTPYEVFRTYLRTLENPAVQSLPDGTNRLVGEPISHWGYHKHNLVTAPAPVATQIMHAAGIAFASKLRKAAAVTVAYCGDGATAEPDFLEGLTFAAQHQLPAVFICEQDTPLDQPSTLSLLTLPDGLHYARVDGSDVLAVYTATQQALAHARAGLGPTLLEMIITRFSPTESHADDPLSRCLQLLRQEDGWEEDWARDLEILLRASVEQALTDVLEGNH